MSKKASLEITRARLEAKIEELVALLDLLDGDENLEDGGDEEPSIGSHTRLMGEKLEYYLEADNSDYEPTWAGRTRPAEKHRLNLAGLLRTATKTG